MNDDAPAPRDTDATGDGTLTEDFDSFLREAARVTDVPLFRTDAGLAPGTALCGTRFELVRILGAGGMGTVYEAIDRSRDARVALKTLHTTGPAWMRRLRSEFVALQDIAHRNLVTLGELHEDDGRLFFTMELLEGETLLDYVRPAGTLDEDRLRRALPQLVEGLMVLHDAGKMHRDVKPSNILVADERVVLLDFGLVQDAAAGLESSDGGGTIPYMAPEQSPGGDIGPAVDWYALGVVLFEALTGRLPFEGSARDIANAKLRGPDDSALAHVTPRDLASLCAALLAPSPHMRPSAEDIARQTDARMSSGDTAPPFVGRQAELERMRRAFAVAADAGGRVHVQGGPGLGKSSLLDEFTAWLRRDTRAVVLASRCYERVSIPYRAIEGIATALAHHLRRLPAAQVRTMISDDAGLLPGVFPALGEVEAIAACSSKRPDVPDVQQQRMRVFDAFRDLVAEVSKTAPLVLIIDDFQWADADGVRLLDYLVHGDDAPALLVVLAFRDEGAALVASRPADLHLSLGPLAPRDAASLVRCLAPNATESLATTLASEAEFSPLYIAELVRHHRTSSPEHGRAPRLEHAITARAASLPQREQLVLELVALAGGPITQDVVQQTAELDAGSLWSTLASLRVKQLVRTHGPGPHDTVEPYHDRVRQAIVSTFAEHTLAPRHARLAEALDASAAPAVPIDLIVYHLEAAGLVERAAERAVTAAEHASHALAFDRAAELYQRALKLRAHDGDARVPLHIALGDARAAGGRGALAADAYLAAAEVMPRAKSVGLRRQAAEQLLRAGYADRGLHELDGVLRDVRMPATSEARWPVAALLWQRLRLTLRGRRPGSSDAHTTEVQEQLACCWSAVVGLSMVSPLASGIFQARHLRLALDAGDPRRITLGLTLEAVGAAISGPPARKAYRLIHEADAWAKRAGTSDATAYVLFGHAMLRFVCGEWSEALAFADAAERQFRDACIGASWEMGSSQRVSLTCLWHMGRIRELRQRLAHAFADAEHRGDRYALAQMGTVLQPNVYLMDDRLDDARTALTRAAEHLSRTQVTMHHWQHMQATALVALYAGAPHEAVAHMDEVLPRAKRAFLYRVKAVRVFSAFVRGTALVGMAARGDTAALDRADRDCTVLEKELGTGPAAALVRAQVTHLRGDERAAADGYRRAIAGFTADQSDLLRACATWRLGELVGGSDGNTLVAEAKAVMTNEDIARPACVLRMLAPGVARG